MEQLRVSFTLSVGSILVFTIAINVDTSAQAPFIQIIALVRVEGIRPFLYTPERGYAANQTWLPRDPRTGQQGRALGRERARSTEPGSLHTAGDAGEQRISGRASAAGNRLGARS